MNLFYRETGQGAPFVILHGLYGSSDNWVPIARLLSDKYHIVLADLRNHGSSPHSATHCYQDMVTDLAWLFHELEIEKAHLLGHSMGGKVAMSFAADYPEKILSLTVADIAPVNYLENPASALQYNFHRKILDALFHLDLSRCNDRKEVEGLLKDDLPETSLRKFMMKNLYRNNEGRLQWKINVPVLRESLEHIISGAGYHNFEDRIPILNYPVHFIKGEHSGYITDEHQALIRTIYPEARISELPGTTHLLHAEKPEAFVALLKFYLP